MPAMEVAFETGASELKLISNERIFPVDVDTHCFMRVGKDGNIPILPLFHGDGFGGLILEGQWRKWFDSLFVNIDAVDQPFKALLDGDGTLLMEGETDTLGSPGLGGISSVLPMPLMNDLEIIFSMELPVDDTGATADRDINAIFYLTENLELDENPYQNNLLGWNITAQEQGFRFNVQSRIQGVSTWFHVGPDADNNDSSYAVGDLKGCVFRVVFHDGVPGSTSPEDVRHMHVYLRQGETIDDALLATEAQLVDSPYDISDLRADLVYPSLIIKSWSQTYFDLDNEFKSYGIEVKYPPFRVEQNQDPSDFYKNDVELWDGNPDSGGIQVMPGGEDHVFSDDIFLRNGLNEWQIEEGVHNAAWGSYYDPVQVDYVRACIGLVFYTDDVGAYMYNHWLEKIVYISPEKIVLRIKITDTIVNDDNNFMKYNVTMRRGMPYIVIDEVEPYPMSDIKFGAPRINKGLTYAGVSGSVYDAYVSDFDIVFNFSNPFMDDNYGIAWDNDLVDNGITILATNKKPNASFNGFGNSPMNLDDYNPDEIGELKFMIGMIYCEYLNHMVFEAESQYGVSLNAVRSYIDKDHDGFTVDYDMATEAQPEEGVVVLYEDDETWWNTGATWGTGSLGTPTQSEELSIVQVGTSSAKVVMTSGAGETPFWGHDYGIGTEIDISVKKYVGFYFYGANTGEVMTFYLETEASVFVGFQWTDNFSGWQWKSFRTDGTDNIVISGAYDSSSIRYLLWAVTTPDVADTWYIDHLILSDSAFAPSHVEIYEDTIGDLAFHEGGSGSYGATISSNTTDEKTGTACAQLDIVAGSFANVGWRFDFGGGNGQDWTAKNYSGFWFYGENSGLTIRITLYDDSADSIYFDFTDNVSGWRWMASKFADYTEVGTFDQDDVKSGYIVVMAVDSDTYEFKIDHWVIFEGLWDGTTNCTTIITEDTENSEGDYCVEITSTAAGGATATCTPIQPIGNILKFDDIRFWVHGDPDPSAVTIRLVDADGDSVRKAVSVTGSATFLTVDIPHSSSDLQGWTETGTYDFANFANWRVEWTAAAGSEVVYVDGARFYIGNTTARGRGQTLSGGSAAVLDAQEEYLWIDLIAGTDLPAGMWLALHKSRDTEQLANSVRLDSRNASEGEHRHEENQPMGRNLTSLFRYYGMIFHISDADVTRTDSIRVFRIYNNLPLENTVFVDQVVLIHIGDGMTQAVDLAHSYLKTFEQEARLYDI